MTETTVVTITINPYNRKIFTHAVMSNGHFYVRALSTDINLNSFIPANPDANPNHLAQLRNLRYADEDHRLLGYVLPSNRVCV